MTVKELKKIINSLPEDNLEVRVEIQEDGMGTAYPLSIVHYERGRIYLVGGDHEKDGLWEVGTIIYPREEEPKPAPRINNSVNIGGQMVRKMIEFYEGKRR